jgi:predicted CXXCH cytochrome family protein
MTNRVRALAAAVLLSLVWTARVRPQGAPPAVPPKSPAATVVGATACASCHQAQFDIWKGGRHSKMVQPATSASVRGDFSSGPVTLRGSAYRFRAEKGQFYITESYLTGKEQEHRVEYTLGNRRVQHYLTTVENGWMIVLPPSWDLQRREWFHNMEIVRPAAGDPKPVQLWNKECVGCHVSQEEVNYNPATRTYATRWVDSGTSCERCHGPGSAHVQQYRQSDETRPVGQRLIVRPTRLDAATSSSICAQCHSLRELLAPDFKAGENYFDYFRPVLEYETHVDRDPPYWADGRPRRFSNDALGLWQSQCFLRGGATCTSCHKDPHQPDVDRNVELAATNNKLCTTCHQEIGARPTAHTRHRADGAGSSCVDCHMPRTVVSLKSTMRDHTMSVPAPENTVAFGIPNACTECHKDRKAEWAVDVLRQWWPQGRRAQLVARAQAFTGGLARRPDALDALVAIARDDRQGPLVQANALGYLRNYADARSIATLLAATKSQQPVVRSVALLSLNLAPNAVTAGQESAPDGRTGSADAAGPGAEGIRGAHAAFLAALDDPRRAVRLSALASLINAGNGGFDPTDERRFRRVSSEFAAKAHLYEDDARVQSDLGVVRLLGGDFDLAAGSFQNSLLLEPGRPVTPFLFALARLGQHRVDDALALLKQVAPSDPYYGAAQNRLRAIAAQPR